jgi:hypothetical protein
VSDVSGKVGATIYADHRATYLAAITRGGLMPLTLSKPINATFWPFRIDDATLYLAAMILTALARAIL